MVVLPTFDRVPHELFHKLANRMEIKSTWILSSLNVVAVVVGFVEWNENQLV